MLYTMLGGVRSTASCIDVLIRHRSKQHTYNRQLSLHAIKSCYTNNSESSTQPISGVPQSPFARHDDPKCLCAFCTGLCTLFSYECIEYNIRSNFSSFQVFGLEGQSGGCSLLFSTMYEEIRCHKARGGWSYKVFQSFQGLLCRTDLKPNTQTFSRLSDGRSRINNKSERWKIYEGGVLVTAL